MKRLDPVLAGLAALLTAVLWPVAAWAEDPEALLQQHCASCHQSRDNGELSRIDEARRTPEGWEMTVVRMMQLHGVELNHEERRTLVRHLADTRGLAPAETRDWRYILERRPDVIESPPDQQMAEMCARCHSFARVALQRRDRADWLRLAHFHLGQYPTTEYQALARDRNWWELATGPVADQLAEMYPLDSSDWENWQAAERPDPAGVWRVVGHRPGKGRYTGTAAILPGDAEDDYRITLNLSYADGDRVDGTGRAVLYTGHEWRAGVRLGEEDTLQVLGLSESGDELGGRWFLADSDALGADIRMVRSDGQPILLHVEPPYLRSGRRASVVLYGVGLDNAPIDLGEGVQVHRVLYRSPSAIALDVETATDTEPGLRDVRVGELLTEGLFTVYERVDSVRVEPEYTIARVGGNDGPLPPVPAQFDAVAYFEEAEGEPVRIGVMPAAWSVVNASPAAEAMRDADFAGRITATGLFLPADAGPNPERRFSTNNAGELDVIATIGEGEQAVSGSARLIVTVQRWNDPPIR